MILNLTGYDYFSGTVEDTELIEGLVFTQRSAGMGGPSTVEKAKIGLIQFCLSPPKTDVCTILSCYLNKLRLFFTTFGFVLDGKQRYCF